MWQDIDRRILACGTILTDDERSYVKAEGQVKAETARKLLAAFKGMLGAAGVTGEEILKSVLKISIPKKGKARVKKLLRAGFEAGFLEDMKRQPEPTEAQIAGVLQMLEALENSPSQVRRLLMQKVKELPHAPGGPRRKLTTTGKEIAACAEVISLHADLSHREALHRVALRHGMSDRTMYRVWRKHNPKRKE